MQKWHLESECLPALFVNEDPEYSSSAGTSQHWAGWAMTGMGWILSVFNVVFVAGDLMASPHSNFGGLISSSLLNHFQPQDVKAEIEENAAAAQTGA